MSKPLDPDRPTSASRAPKSGRKYIDPTKYQMDTVPTELVAKIAQMRIQRMPEEELRPPPLFDERPIIGRLRRLGEWIVWRRKRLAVGCLVALCVVVAVTMMWKGITRKEPSEEVRVQPTRATATAGVPSQSNGPDSRLEATAPVAASNDEQGATLKAPMVSTAGRSAPTREVPSAKPVARTKEPPTAPRRTSTSPKQEKPKEPQGKSPRMPINPIYTAE